MPSPFPGMDPYLEDPGLGPDVHHGLISEMQAQLNSQVSPRYFVRVEARVYISDENDPGRSVIVPDVQIVPGAGGASRTATAPASLAGVEVAEPVMLTTLIEDEIREARLQVIDRERRAVVTIIEAISPANKVPGSRGRENFLEKRQATLRTATHWVEIDLLRAGTPLRSREVLPPADYYVHVSRRAERPRGWVWPILLTQRLPVVPIPLRPDDEDARLDLQAVLNRAYDRAGYEFEIDYAKPPSPPLPQRYLQWADALLRSKGRR